MSYYVIVLLYLSVFFLYCINPKPTSWASLYNLLPVYDVLYEILRPNASTLFLLFMFKLVVRLT
jgi:hypothetical protein